MDVVFVISSQTEAAIYFYLFLLLVFGYPIYRFLRWCRRQSSVYEAKQRARGLVPCQNCSGGRVSTSREARKFDYMAQSRGERVITNGQIYTGRKKCGVCRGAGWSAPPPPPPSPMYGSPAYSRWEAAWLRGEPWAGEYPPPTPPPYGTPRWHQWDEARRSGAWWVHPPDH